MKIKSSIIEIIDNPLSRTRIALKLECGEQSVAVQIRNNNENGRLTKMDALQAISEESGIPVSELLEKEVVEKV